MTRSHLIIKVSQLRKVVFNEVCETSIETVRHNVERDKAMIRWDGDQPAFVSNLTETEGPYTPAEIKAILQTDAWTDLDATP